MSTVPSTTWQDVKDDVPVRITLQVTCSNWEVAQDIIAVMPSRDLLSARQGVETVTFTQEVGTRG